MLMLQQAGIAAREQGLDYVVQRQGGMFFALPLSACSLPSSICCCSTTAPAVPVRRVDYWVDVARDVGVMQVLQYVHKDWRFPPSAGNEPLRS